LLAYFITFQGERIPTDQVFDALWQYSAGRSKEQTLKFILVETSEY